MRRGGPPNPDDVGFRPAADATVPRARQVQAGSGPTDQSTDRLEMGLIRPSNSSMASPSMCVAKRDGGMRLAVDKYIVGETYPMTTIDEVVKIAGRESFISTFDAKSGYWQPFVAPEDRWLTAFVTHDSFYEWV